MSISLKPKDHFGAIYCFIQIPFYSFKDFIQKKEIHFTDEEINKFEVSPLNEKEIYLHYSKHGYYGDVFLNSHFEKIELESNKIIFYKRTDFEKFKDSLLVIFNWHSPFIWGYILQVLTSLGLIEIARRNNYWVNDAKTIINGCDKNCIHHNYQIALTSIAHTYLQLLMLTVGIYFFVVHSKKIKDGNLSGKVKFGALCIIIFGLFGTIEAYKNLKSPGTQQAILLTYAPSKIKHIDRSLASEVENLSEYKSSFGKDEKHIKANKINFNRL